ncbi:MAG: NAD(P)/FAD-dependent oxidoreductase [Bacteroidota bacterium]
MNRKEFLKISSILGVHLSAFPAYSKYQSNFTKRNSSKKVLIIGAGAAGLSAGHLLQQQGIDFKILEASAGYGGRMKTLKDFVDYPIPLGAEWITSSTLPFNLIAGSNSASEKIQTVGYTQDDGYGVWYNGKLVRGDLGTLLYRKFINSSWLDFFEEFILPSVADKISYQSVVRSIDYSGEKVVINTADEELTADQVIVTVPLKILQDKKIQFNPALPSKKLEVINNAVVWDGLKVFIEFKEKFYPAFVDLIINPETDGQVSYYDASFGQNTKSNVLGMFAVGKPAKERGELNNDDLKSYILTELDEIFSNRATPNYLRHVVQNWSEEPYIESAYISDHSEVKTVRQLQKPIDGKIYFAGDCYTSGKDWGNVHNAVESAQDCVNDIIS